MSFTSYTLACMTAFCASAAWSQIGHPVEDIEKKWGSPISGQLSTAGIGTLQYEENGYRIEAVYERGLLKNITYRKDSLSNVAIQECLKRNQGEANWERWTPPGRPSDSTPGQGMWMRDDEMAVARWNSNQLTIQGILPPDEEAEEQARQKAIAPQTPSPTDSPQPNPPAIKTPQKTQIPPANPKKKAPKKPAKRPTIGTTEEHIIQQYGTPNGKAEVGAKKMLVYAWGTVWVKDGLVINVE